MNAHEKLKHLDHIRHVVITAMSDGFSIHTTRGKFYIAPGDFADIIEMAALKEFNRQRAIAFAELKEEAANAPAPLTFHQRWLQLTAADEPLPSDDPAHGGAAS